MEEGQAARIGTPKDSGYLPVVIYTSNDCRWCGVAKEYLSRRGVPYTEKNVEFDEAAGMEAMRLAGQRRTPVIAVGSQVIVGFQRRELDAALGLSAPDPTSEAARLRSEDAN
jgi:glutaredoxin